MEKQYVIALDQGTTSSRAMLIKKDGSVAGVCQIPFAQIYPKPGWVEHDPLAILSSQVDSLSHLVEDFNLTAEDIDSIGVTNQRETTIVWNRKTGKPISNAIVWQCRRTAAYIEALKKDPETVRIITEKTGLVPDAYFSASKIRWILDNVEGAREAAWAGDLAFGTVDCWLLWNLTQGAVHATDVTNASRTMLYNIHDGEWDPWLLDLFGIPASMLPEVKPSATFFGKLADTMPLPGVAICGLVGDQQSALFGQCCFGCGQAKNTYGTGCFLLMHTGYEAKASQNGLITTIAASAPDAAGTEYALEGSVFMAGALIDWLKDGIGLIDDAKGTEALAQSVPDTAGVFLVPAFTGLGAPYWDADARGAVFGLTRGTTKAHIVRAALESLAYQLKDLVDCMEADAGRPLSVMNVDGGVSANAFLMQFQSDLLGVELRKPQNAETTALGAAFLAGLCSGFWSSKEELLSLRSSDIRYEPKRNANEVDYLMECWHEAVKRASSH